MWPVAFIASFTGCEKGAQSSTSHAKWIPRADNVLYRACSSSWSVHQSLGRRNRNALMAFPQLTVCQGQCLMCLTGPRQKHSPAIMRQSQPALEAAGTTIRAALSAGSGREGRYPSYSTVVQWGFKPAERDLTVSIASWPAEPCLKDVCWPLPERSIQSKATMIHGDSPFCAVLLYQ